MEAQISDEILVADASGASNDYLSVALECAHDGVVIADSNAVMIYANRSYEQISGFNRSDMIGRNMNELMELGYISVSGTLHVLETGEPFSTTQMFKTRRQAVIVSTPVYDENGKIFMVVTNLRDTTDICQMKSELRRREIQNQRYCKKLQSLRRELGGKVDMIAADRSTAAMLRFAQHVAEINDPVLLVGEVGTGKKKLAKFIHQHSDRSLMPFVRITLNGDSSDAQMAYLFGSRRGGDGQTVSGALNAADGGTVYFDEISSLLPEALLKLDEILATGSYTLNGVSQRINIRIIAASRYSLEELRRFIPPESELFRQLSLFPIQIPPLRKRSDDVIPLLDLFLSQYNQKTGRSKSFTPKAYQRLMRFSWPGNIAQLQNLVKRAAIISDSDVIDEDTLAGLLDPGSELEAGEPAAPCLAASMGELPEQMNLKLELERLEAHYMTLAFNRYHNTRKAADSLEMGVSTFIRKRQQYEKQGLMQRDKKPLNGPT